MTVHVISVGIGILDKLAKPGDLLAAARRPAARDVLADELFRNRPGGQDVSDRLGEILRLVAAEDSPEATKIAVAEADLWPAELSPELSTFKAVLGQTQLRDPDVAVLIATDTKRGLTAALLNAVALTWNGTGGPFGRVRYAAAGDQLGGKLAGGAVIVRVKGLDAGSETSMADAMEQFGLIGKQLLDARPAQEEYQFYLSGGYKATIPYLIGLAEGMRTARGERRGVTAWVLHEESNAKIPLPLRSFPLGVATQELTGWGLQGRRQELPMPGHLNGYAYEADGEGWRLTAFGKGLQALLGQRDEAL